MVNNSIPPWALLPVQSFCNGRARVRHRVPPLWRCHTFPPFPGHASLRGHFQCDMNDKAQMAPTAQVTPPLPHRWPQRSSFKTSFHTSKEGRKEGRKTGRQEGRKEDGWLILIGAQLPIQETEVSGAHPFGAGRLQKSEDTWSSVGSLGL